MSHWWSGLSLKNKLQFPIQLILLLVLMLAQHLALDRFKSDVLNGAVQKAKVSADGVLNGLNMLMINGIISDAEQRALYVTKMGASDKVNELRVIRNKPVQDQFGPGLPSEQPVDEMDRAALQTAQMQTKLTANDGEYQFACGRAVHRAQGVSRHQLPDVSQRDRRYGEWRDQHHAGSG